MNLNFDKRSIRRRAAKIDARELSDAEVIAAMTRARFRVARAAEDLGVSRSWLHIRIASCGGLGIAKALTAEQILTASRQVGNEMRAIAQQLRVSEHGLKLRLGTLNLTLPQGGKSADA